MRCSGVTWFHIWRVVPTQQADGTTTFTVLIDGKDKGALMSTTLQDAVFEAKQMIEQMMKDGQK
jgi:hypothetical protein